MLLSIPYQTFEIENVHLTPFQMDKYGKAIAQLMYKDNSIDFQDISLLTPPIRVLYYHADSSRLKLDISEHNHFQIKMNMLQDYLVGTFYTHQQSFLNETYKSLDYIRQLFYFLLDDAVLSLYMYPTTAVKLANGTTSTVAELKPGEMIRCVVRFQGISQFMHRDGVRLRIHHSVPCLWKLA
jgi:hypothetical protein